MGAIQAIKNFFFASPNDATGQQMQVKGGNLKKNLSNYISPVQLQRLRQDVQSWREAASESELAWYPQRVKMQRLFIDTVLNGHVEACMNTRRDLTLLRDFKLCNDKNVEDENITMVLRSKWFYNFIYYALESQAYGYTLISMGDLVSDAFPKMKPVRRWNVSPDRYNVTAFVYSLSGVDFREDPYRLWHIYIPTPTDHGVSPCGYGYLYKAAIYEIICRNLLGHNADFTELYSQPYRIGKTNKTEATERDSMQEALQNMGSSGWAVLDMDETIEFVETKLSGTGWQGYENLEQRCEKKISKIILGHADALDSIPGKLGNDGEESPAEKAKKAKQANDGKFIENLVNEELLPRLREMGMHIPEELHFEYKNDDEKQEIRRREDTTNKATAEIAKTMKDAGMQMDPSYFTERTGIPATIIVTPAPVIHKSTDDELNDDEEDPEKENEKEAGDKDPRSVRVKNKLKMLYNM